MSTLTPLSRQTTSAAHGTDTLCVVPPAPPLTTPTVPPTAAATHRACTAPVITTDLPMLVGAAHDAPFARAMSSADISEPIEPFQLFSETAIVHAQEYYLPVFRDIRTYGTRIEPLFIARDVERVLGLTDMHYSDNRKFAPGTDKQTIRVRTDRGVRSMIALTEYGLMFAIYRARTTEVAHRFRVFVVMVLRLLRLNGTVSMSDAAMLTKQTLESRLDEANRTVNRLSIQIDTEQLRAIQMGRYAEQMSTQVYDLESELLRMRLETSQLVADRDPVHQRYEAIAARVMTRVWISEARAVGDGDSSSDASDTEDSMRTYRISLREPRNPVAHTWIMSALRLIAMHTALDRWRVAPQRYECSVAEIRDAADVVNTIDASARSSAVAHAPNAHAPNARTPGAHSTPSVRT